MHARIVVPIDSARSDSVPGSYGEQFGGAGHAVHLVLAPSFLWGFAHNESPFAAIAHYRHTSRHISVTTIRTY